MATPGPGKGRLAARRGRANVERKTDAQGWELLRDVMVTPNAEAYLSADCVHREVRRLQTRLGRVHARGGAYRDVGLSDDVGALLARLEVGRTLSTFVH